MAGASERGSVVSAEPILGPSIVETLESAELPVSGDETHRATETRRCSKYLWSHNLMIHNPMQMFLPVSVV